MKILLLGECSNLHWTLAQALRQMGHEVTVASDGSRWMNNARDINLARKDYGIFSTIKYICGIYKNLDKFKGYDIVQIKNPVFLDLKAKKNLKFFHFLKKHNKRVFMGAFGTDYYWIKTCLDHTTFRYSDYYIGDKYIKIDIAETHRQNWIATDKQRVNEEIAHSCDGIVACLYEYYMSYVPDFKDKLRHIPIPVNADDIEFRQRGESDLVRFFIGIQTDRSQLKGTDIIYKVLHEIQSKYPNKCSILKAESVPYKEYVKMTASADILLDQLYSYTPSMNALGAMAQGLVAVSGGEPELYELLQENEIKPIINVLPDEQDIFDKLEELILNKKDIPTLSLQSRSFVERHHHYMTVAKQYVDFWTS